MKFRFLVGEKKVKILDLNVSNNVPIFQLNTNLVFNNVLYKIINMNQCVDNFIGLYEVIYFLEEI